MTTLAAQLPWAMYNGNVIKPTAKYAYNGKVYELLTCKIYETGADCFLAHHY